MFLNPDVSSYLRELAGEFSLSPATLKSELDGLTSAGYLEKAKNGRSIRYSANQAHPLFPEIHSIVCKYLGLDSLVEQIVTNLGTIESAYLLDDYAQGKDTGIIDVLIVGDVLPGKLESLKNSVEKKIKRKVRTLVVGPDEFQSNNSIYMRRPHWQIV